MKKKKKKKWPNYQKQNKGKKMPLRMPKKISKKQNLKKKHNYKKIKKDIQKINLNGQDVNVLVYYQMHNIQEKMFLFIIHLQKKEKRSIKKIYFSQEKH